MGWFVSISQLPLLRWWYRRRTYLWQEVTVEELAFWARHFPGLRGLAKAEQGVEVGKFRKERPDLVELYETELRHTERLTKDSGQRNLSRHGYW